MNKCFVEAYKEAFGHFPSPVGEDDQVAFFNAVVKQCILAARGAVTSGETEFADDAVEDIIEELNRLCVKGE